MKNQPLAKIAEVANYAIALAGGPAEMGRKAGVTTQAVMFWQIKGIPKIKVGRVSGITGMPIHVLRPDLFTAPDSA